MLTTLFVEFRKLKGSLVLVLCLVAPTLVAILLAVVCVRQPIMTWHNAMQGGTGLWAYFVMPLAITALGILLAQIEHGPRTWDHILALPIQRWRLFAAKGIVLMLLIGAMSLLLALEIRLVDALVKEFAPQKVPTGPFPWALQAKYLGTMWGASLFMAMLQLWVALRFHSFVPPLTLGLSGTFFAVAAFGAKETVFMPWVMPVSIVAGDPGRAVLALELGLVGGMLTSLLMIWHLSRREA
jgi:lantibiotic transport system permease protein